MDTNKLNILRMTYIGHANIFGSGEVGGARVKNMINIFRIMGIKIELVTYSFSSDRFGIEHHQIDPSLKVTIVHTRTKSPRVLKALAIFPIFFYAFRSCKKSDFIFSDFIAIIASFPAILFGKIFNKPTILDYQDKKLIEIIPNIFYKYLARNASAICAISYYLLDFSKREYSCKNVIYVPNGIDTNHFKIDMDHRKQIREKLYIRNEEIVIGYAGSFFYVEGVPILLKAFKKLIYKHPNIRLAIMGKLMHISDSYGDPNYDDILKIIEDLNIKDKVILIPPQSHDEVPKFLSAFDILSCPKIDCEINRAANPVKVPEYLSMGLPTICSAIGGINDIIEDEFNGLLVKPGDIEDLTNRLEWIIMNPERSKEIGENGRRTAIKECSYEAIEKTIKRAISEL